MLQYRSYLQESRARRGETSFPVHYQMPQKQQEYDLSLSNQNIKDFVSNPGYGEIFYGDGKNAQHQNVQIKQSLHGEKNRSAQLSKYVSELEEENAMLRAKLNQFMRQQQQQNAAYNQASHQYVINPTPIYQTEYHEPAPVAPPQGYASQPISSQSPRVQQVQRAPRVQHIPQSTYQIQAQSMQAPPRSNQGQSGYFATAPNPSFSLKSLAQQKLNLIKDDDQQLRQYTIQLLKKPYY